MSEQNESNVPDQPTGAIAVPDDFPRDPFPASLSGSQPKFAARLVDGKYVVGLTEDERIERYLMCDDMVGQLIVYVEKKRVEKPDLGIVDLLGQVDVGIRRKGWELGSVEFDWIMKQLRVKFL